MGEIDKDFYEGLEKVRQLFLETPGYEELKFTTVIHAKNVVKNHFKSLPYRGLFFSGGCDSTAAYLKYKGLGLKLIMIWGLDIPTYWPEFWHRVEEQYSHLNCLKIKTNTEDLYNYEYLWKLGEALPEGYRGGYSFSINTFGVAAPLTIAEGIGDLMLSSTYPFREFGDPQFPWTNRRLNFKVDELLGWANVKTRDVLGQFSTNEKVRLFIRPYLESQGSLFLRSCGHRQKLKATNFKNLNCGICDKCQRVIGMLVVNGIDPAQCGFPIRPETFTNIQRRILRKGWNPMYLKYHWQEIKKAIPKRIRKNFHGSKGFLEWLRNFDLETYFAK